MNTVNEEDEPFEESVDLSVSKELETRFNITMALFATLLSVLIVTVASTPFRDWILNLF